LSVPRKFEDFCSRRNVPLFDLLILRTAEHLFGTECRQRGYESIVSLERVVALKSSASSRWNFRGFWTRNWRASEEHIRFGGGSGCWSGCWSSARFRWISRSRNHRMLHHFRRRWFVG
jgi:hypothetical protein